MGGGGWTGHNGGPARVETKAGVLRKSFSKKRKHYFSHWGGDASSRRRRRLERLGLYSSLTESQDTSLICAHNPLVRFIYFFLLTCHDNKSKSFFSPLRVQRDPHRDEIVLWREAKRARCKRHDEAPLKTQCYNSNGNMGYSE